jgi:hypothetical protein
MPRTTLCYNIEQPNVMYAFVRCPQITKQEKDILPWLARITETYGTVCKLRFGPFRVQCRVQHSDTLTPILSTSGADIFDNFEDIFLIRCVIVTEEYSGHTIIL